jgi:rhamnosyl/mannosyltransferase
MKLNQSEPSLLVTHCYRAYFPDQVGGLEEAMRQFCFTTIPFGVKSTVFCLSPNPKPNKICRPECQVIRRRSWWSPYSCDLGGVDSFLEFTRLARKSNVLHYQFPWPFADVLHLVARPKIPAVITYHSDIVRQEWLNIAYNPLMWKMLSSMRFIVATSPVYLRTSPVLSHPLVRDKVRVIPLGIEESSYPKEGDNEIFKRIGIEANDPYFLFIGVLRYYKGLHFLIQAAKSVRAPVVIVGLGKEGLRLQALAAQVKADNVVFAGYVKDAEKAALLKRCRALVLPSHLRSEAFGMVLVEAAMFGRPMISCEIGTGTSFVNAHDETGLVVAPESPEELAQAMNTLLADDKLAAQMGSAARARYEQFFSGPALGRAYAKLYREAAG